VTHIIIELGKFRRKTAEKNRACHSCFQLLRGGIAEIVPKVTSPAGSTRMYKPKTPDPLGERILQRV
jgi:hypothetical protein